MTMFTGTKKHASAKYNLQRRIIYNVCEHEQEKLNYKKILADNAFLQCINTIHSAQQAVSRFTGFQIQHTPPVDDHL